MTATRSGIPTTFRSTNFRSRLESRWAAFFDLVGWKWTYEPFDADGYIPDFLIHGPASLIVEVGPCDLLSDFSLKAEKPRATLPDRVTLVVGVDPLILQGTPGYPPAAGYMTPDPNRERGPEIGCWVRCQSCMTLGDLPERDWLAPVRPCGHGFVDDLPDDAPLRSLSTGELFDAWATAGNKVQWRGSRQ